jgi:hypothetical protein
MIVEKQMEWRLAGETEVLGENLPQRHFCPSQNPAWPDPGLNPGRRGGKLATNRLSCGAAQFKTLIIRLLYFPTACFCQANTAAMRFFICKDVIYLLNYTLAFVKMCSHINNNAETSIAVTEKWIECVRGVSCRGSIEVKTWRDRKSKT